MIPSFNNHFNKLLKRLNSNNNFILGLSGGKDSMSLLHLIKNFIDDERNISIKCMPIIIDHNIRNVSEKEAKEVKKISQSLGFDTKIKKINMNKPNGNIQNWARKQRRFILHQKCLELSANLILGHHFDDQAETLFMRMTKNSGLAGLSGMSDISSWNGVFILRPLLFCKKKQIENFVRDNKIPYFEDISNNNHKFERVRTRFYLNCINKHIWPNISGDLNHFGNLNSDLLKKTNYHFNSWAKKNIIIHEAGAVRVDYDNLKTIFKKSYLFAVRIVGKIIQTVGGKEYSPKRKKTHDLLSSIFTKKIKKKTLGNVNVSFSQSYLFFVRENRNLNFDIKIEKNKYYIFDGRFLIKSSLSGKLVKNENSDLIVPDYKNPFHEYSYWINNSIPYLETLEGKTIKPHMYKMNENSNLSKGIENCFNLYLINRFSM